MTPAPTTPAPEPTWAIVGDDAPLSDAAISALAALLLSIDSDQEGT